MSNPQNVIGGHKATLSNPNTSEEAKQHSKEVLKQEGYTVEETGGSGATGGSDDSGMNPNNVIGGHKATLSNPNTSEEAKQHSKEVLEREGHNVGGTGGSGQTGSSDDSGKNSNNVIGGHKANLKNPNISEEAKQHSQHILEQEGYTVKETGGSGASGSSGNTGGTDDSGKNPNNVIGGLKATTKNPNVSEEAKESAEQRLKEMGQ